jgi:DnaJ family protein C protein 13
MVSYPALESELFCDIFYLRNLCNVAKFPDWPISNPLKLLKEVLMAWRTEVEKKPSSMTAADALSVLGEFVDIIFTLKTAPLIAERSL